MRVAFKDRTVHEGSWISFVRIAEHILGASGCCGAELPFQTCGEPCAAPPPDPGGLHLFNDLFRSHLEQGLGGSHIAIPCNIFIDIVRVYQAPILEGHEDLAAEESDL